MANCTVQEELFGSVGRRRIEVGFDGGDITSDAGLLLIRKADEQMGLLSRVAVVLPDPRDPERIDHSVEELLRQRVYGLALGYEDLNDHDRLRHDLALQTVLGKMTPGASSPTLCRLEQRADRDMAGAIHGVILDRFVASFATAPTELILDFDATDDPVHGNQEGRFFHGYYDHYCFLPLYVFCGEQLLVSYLRPAKIDGAKHAGAILKLLVKRLRTAWPEVRLIFRGDSGFCRRRILSWCERNGVGYIVGLARNPRIEYLASWWMESALEAHALTGTGVRCFGEIYYRSGTWREPRRVIVKAEITHTAKANPRFVVTNLTEHPQTLYEEIYCARGEMENRIKECQLGLFADRTSCHRWWPNQFRLMIASLAYVLMQRLRNVGLAGSELANAQTQTIRIKLLKLGAIVVRNTRRIRFFIASAFPLRKLFLAAAARLDTT